MLVRPFQLSYKMSLTSENRSSARFSNLLFLFSFRYSVVFLKTYMLSKDREEKGKIDIDDIYLIVLNTKEGKVATEPSRASQTKNQKLVWQFS